MFGINPMRAVLLRRCLHSKSLPKNSPFFASRARIVTATSSALLLSAFLTWRISSSHQIHLDSVSATEKSDVIVQAGSGGNDNTSSQNSTAPGSELLQEKQEEANQESDAEGGGGAFDPVTGEINWDCPCLGGMAHGPCGPQFREAFSCFVYSEEEPKGINCVEKFKAMQDCFRQHPEVYGEEIMDDDDDNEETADSSTSSDQIKSDAH